MIDKISIEFQDCAIIFSATLLPSLENFEKKALLTCCYFVARCGGVWCASATLSKKKEYNIFFTVMCLAILDLKCGKNDNVVSLTKKQGEIH